MSHKKHLLEINSCSKCTKCSSLERRLEKTTNPKIREKLLQMRQYHNMRQMAERKYYYRKRDLAKAHPTRYLSLIIDGMDQSKTNLPHFVGRTAKGGTLPPVLYIQADNCWRENKNKYVLSFCELLVHICMKVFQEVHLSFLYVGHTHEDIDAGFSKRADSLRRNDAETIPELLDLLPNPSNLIWQYDIRSWLEPFIADVRKHTKPLHYKFTMDEVSNKIKLCYKSIHAGPWKISTSGMFMFSDKGEVELPKGVPKVATPVFDKISIEKIESGINDWKCLFTDQIEHHQFNWWKSRVNYMKKLRDDNQFMKSEIIQKAVWYLDKLPKIRVTPDCLEDNNPPKEIEDMINQVLIEHEIKKMAREACNGQFKKLAKVYEQDVTESIKKYQVLKDLDLFVLDNSIRESTVGRLRGHTIENKWKVYDEVKKCGFKHTIVASFNHSTQVDDVFIKQLIDKGEDRAGLWAFSEITEAIKKKVPDTESIPVGLRKMKEAGLYNVIFEIDLGDSTYDFDRFTTKEMCALLKKWIDWVFKNLSTEAKVFVNFRDLPDAMPTDSEREFEVTDFLCKLPLFGLMFEEPRGQSLPEECGTWAKHIRKVMDANNFKSHLLVHVHEKFGYCDAVALQVLMDGANGIWASVIKEGAAIGNAPSIVTILNLIRMGNKKVLKKFNCTYLRKAAINMTRITTGVDPHIKQPVYGARALDFVFDLNAEEFDFAEFFEEKAPIRITTISSAKMVQTKLVNYFGENKDFTIERANLMKEVMLEDLRANRKEEYMSKCGLAVLFDRAGGKLTDEIRDEIANDPIKTPHGQNLLKEIRERWDEWDLKDKVQGDNLLDFDSFYNGFMAPYFACYRCNDTKKALQALDMDSDNSVDWSEFCVFLKWALKQYPKTILTADDLLEVAFRKGLIPCMRDEMVGKK